LLTATESIAQSFNSKWALAMAKELTNELRLLRSQS
jgi:hypothetical protein